jgi:predicted Zn-dependent peptidase
LEVPALQFDVRLHDIFGLAGEEMRNGTDDTATATTRKGVTRPSRAGALRADRLRDESDASPRQDSVRRCRDGGAAQGVYDRSIMPHRSAPAAILADAAVPAIATLDNGVRVVVFRLPHLATVAVSVFVRSGSQHESARQNGISHVIEHMAFKGTRSRDCQQINLDAERLGADVNAHTDKDHTAFHMRGLARDAGAFVGMLADIVRESTFPEAELERERAVLMHEYAEVDDDAMETAFKLFDKACFGDHPAARPVIGSRANIRRLTRADLVAHVQRQFTGTNTIVGVAGDVDADRVVAAAQDAFGDMPRGADNRIAAPDFVGGIHARRLTGSSQAHAVLGFPIPPLPGEHHTFVVAAALFGEGMSSPLLDQLRERRGLVYHADCSTDVRDSWGQFVVEASTGPEHVGEYFAEVTRLLREHVDATDPVGLERARNQIAVRRLGAQEVPAQLLEHAALDLFALDRVRPRDEFLADIAAVTPSQVRGAFAQMLDAGAAVGLAGRIARGEEERIARLLARRGTEG